MQQYCFGIDIGGTSIKCGLFTKEGELKEKWDIPTNRENHGESVPQDVADTILKKIKEKDLKDEEVIGVGIGVPGPVTQDGTVDRKSVV